MPLLDSISHCEFLRAMPKAFVERLNQIARPCAFAPGVVLFVKGIGHPEFHVVVEGHVRLDMLVPRRGRIPILTMATGDVLAWSALIGDSTMTSTAIALEPVKTVAFRGDQLNQLCETEHEIGYHVMRQLASALSRRLLATRLHLLDLFADHIPALDLTPTLGRPGDVQC
jgi:CRP/FNR family cyclic AMP-dependent transcriptional regulator